MRRRKPISGSCIFGGEAYRQNYEAAADCLHRAAVSGVPAAQYFLGLMYDKGEGVAQDFVLAEAWLDLAVAHAEPSWRSRWVLIRDAVASKMSLAQLAEAQRLALDGPTHGAPDPVELSVYPAKWSR